MYRGVYMKTIELFLRGEDVERAKQSRSNLDNARLRVRSVGDRDCRKSNYDPDQSSRCQTFVSKYYRAKITIKLLIDLVKFDRNFIAIKA